jgi:tRNA-modifying protein YgfZ
MSVLVDRAFVMVEGADATTYLHSQLSQEVRDLSVGEARWTLLLAPTGKVEVLARVLRSGEYAYVLDTDRGFGDALVARLNRFKIRVKADVTPIEWRCLSGLGAEASPLAGAVSVPGWWGRGHDFVGPSLDGVADGVAYESARILAGWPAMGAEIEPGDTIPGELPVVPVAVSFTKGCYPGQELVERMDSRGASAPRLLRRVVADGDVAAGASVRAGGSEVGHVTSAAGSAALAIVRRSVEVPASVEIAVDGRVVAGRLEAIEPPA